MTNKYVAILSNRHISMLKIIDECIEFIENINPQPQDCDNCIALLRTLKILMKINYKNDRGNNNEKLLNVLEFCNMELSDARDIKYRALNCNDTIDYYMHSGQSYAYARVIDKIESLLGNDNDEGEED